MKKYKDIKVGDRVKIINMGEIYRTYDRWAKKFKLQNWVALKKPKSSKGIVTVIGEHTWKENTILIGVRIDGFDYIYGYEGLQKIKTEAKKPIKKKYMYLHTIDGLPAGYSETNKQICFANKSFKPKLVKTLKQIRKEQQKTFKFRKENGYSFNEKDYDYVLVEVEKIQ